MKNFMGKSWRRTGVVTAGCAAVFSFLSSCADRTADAPAPTATPTAALAPARVWYEGLTPSAAAGAAPTAPTKWPLALEWAHAVESEPEATGQVWLVPVHETRPRFANGPDFGHRYLVVRTGGGFSARILEVFSKKQDGRDGAAAIAAAVMADMLHGRLRPVNGFEGAAILYDIRYRYQQGRRYREGQDPLPGERLRIGSGAAPALTQSAAAPGTGPGYGPVTASCGDGCITYTFEGGGEQCDCSGPGVVVNPEPSPPDGGGGVGVGGGGWGGGDGGGGSDGGGGGSGGGGAGGGNDFPNGIYDAPATVQQATPTLGNYSATLAISPNLYQVVNVLVELDTNAKDLKKIVVTLNGVVWFTKFTQIGDGTLTSYNAATDTYSFHVDFQKDLGGYFSSQRTIYGTISPIRGVGTLTLP